MTKIGTWIVAGILVTATVIAAYAMVRISRVHRIMRDYVPNETLVSDLMQGEPLICHGYGGNFVDWVSFTVYIKGTKARADYVDYVAEGVRYPSAHKAFTKEGTMYFWQDGAEVGYVTTSRKWASDTSQRGEYMGGDFSCDVWWFPREEMVQLPQDIPFVPLPK